MERKIRLIVVGILICINSIYGQNPEIIFNKIKDAGCSEKYDDASTLVIFDSTKVDVTETGLSHVSIHKLIKILDTKGALANRSVKFDFDTLSAFIEIKEANIYKNDGRVIRLDNSYIYDYPAPARAIYWGARHKMIAFGRLEKGDAIEIKMYKKGFTYALLYDENDDRYIPPMRGHFYDIVNFWAAQPTLVKYYETNLPKDKPLQYEIYNGELQSSVKYSRDKIVYTFCRRNFKPFEKESNMVATSDVAPKLLMSTAKDWEAKSIWFCGVNEDFGSFDITDEIKEKTDEIVQGAKSDMEKIERLTHWVAEEVRYSGLSMGKGEGFTLHKASMTFLDRCGVCKDKAGMLVAMLRAAGFESYAAMTMARSRIDVIPADQFNHSVAVVKYKGEYILLDPTWVPGVRELWSSAEQQQEYLMGLPEGAGLMSTPISPPEEHYYRVKGTSELSKKGALTGKFTVEAEKQSDAKLRGVFRGTMKNNWNNITEELLYTISPKAMLKNVKYQDPYDLSKPMKIEMEYVIPDYALMMDNEIHFKSVVAGFPFRHSKINSTLFMDVSKEERKYGFRASCSKLAELEEKIKLPKGYKIKNLPKYESINGSGATFEAKYSIKGNTLYFKEKFIQKKRRYEPEDWESFRGAVNSVNDVSNDMLILERKGGKQ